MKIEPRPIIPAQLRSLDHFKGQKQMVWVNTFGMNSLKIDIVEKIGRNGDVFFLALGSSDLDVKMADPSILRLDEFAYLQYIILNHSNPDLLRCEIYRDLNPNHICACYYLEDLKRRYEGNIDMDLFFKAVQNFKLPE
jgi:hypothetical protein